MDVGQLEREEHLLAKVRRGRWWLKLPPELLNRFHAERNVVDLRGSWLAVLCATLVLDSFVFSDLEIVADQSELAVLFRLLVLTPLALAYVPLSRWLVRRNSATNWHHIYAAGFTTVVLAWVCLVQVNTRDPSAGTFYVGAYLVVVFYAAALRAPLAIRVPTLAIMSAIFAASMPWVVVTPVSQRIDATLCMIGFCAFGLLGSHREESSARQRFVLGARTRLLELRRELLLSKLAAANERLTHQATRDALTGVPNRRAADDAMRNWDLGEPTAGAVLIIDLDHFKAYNDTFGHQGGDAVLRQVAQAMAKTLRGDDVMLARYGGEEFVAILRGVTPVGARRAAERLRAAVEAQPNLSPVSSPRCVTVSVGGAWTASSRLCTAQRLLGAADSALYEAKSAGRNAVRFKELIEDRTEPRVAPARQVPAPLPR